MRSLFWITSSIIPSRFTVGLARTKAISPFYHLVSDCPPLHAKHLYKVKSVKEFERDLDYFIKYFSPVDASALKAQLENKQKLSKPNLFLSFDDGFREVKDIVAPILRRKGIPATFFVTPSFVGNADLMYRCKVSLLIERLTTSNLSKSIMVQIANTLGSKIEVKDISRKLLLLNQSQVSTINEIASVLGVDFESYLKVNRPYLDLSELQSLREQGFTIGGHGYNHLYYNQLSYSDQLKDVEECMQWIKTNFPDQLNLFAFPFTDYGVSSELIRRMVCDASPLCDISFGTSGIQVDRYDRHLQRVPMEGKHFNAQYLVDGEILYYIAKKIIGYYKKYD